MLTFFLLIAYSLQRGYGYRGYQHRNYRPVKYIKGPNIQINHHPRKSTQKPFQKPSAPSQPSKIELHPTSREGIPLKDCKMVKDSMHCENESYLICKNLPSSPDIHIHLPKGFKCENTKDGVYLIG
eukprot:NODE_838_length_3589_cov_0.826074.p4 type:complete len:126 gc:universal NODE_838_length_3589_cov_0.826074:2789-3166(+)